MLRNKDKYYRCLVLLLGYLLIWYVNMLIPIKGEIHSGSYRVRMGYIIYTLASIFSMLIIKMHYKKITKKDFFISTILGILSSGGINLIVGIVTFLVYLASILNLDEYSKRTNIIYSKNASEIIKDILIILGTTIFVFMFKEIPEVLLEKINFKFNWAYFKKALPPSISEEVIFRMFLYSIILNFFQGEPSNKFEKFLIYIMLIIPFEVAHFSDIIVSIGLYNIMGSFFSFLLLSFIFTNLFLKRNLFTAIGVHFLVNFISLIMVYN